MSEVIGQAAAGQETPVAEQASVRGGDFRMKVPGIALDPEANGALARGPAVVHQANQAAQDSATLL